MQKETRPGGRFLFVFTIVLIILCQSQQMLANGGISLFLPLIRRDIGLNFAQGGTLAAASTLVYALMQIPSGYLADRFGARVLFTVGLLGTSLLSLSFALLHVYWLLVLNQGISGFFRALMFAPGLLLISDLFPADRRAMAMGLYIAGGASSNVLLNLLGPWLIAPLGWQTLFILLSITGLLLIFTYWRFGLQGSQRSAKKALPLRRVFALFRYREMWLIGAIQYVRLAVANGLQFWIPTFIVVEKGYSLQVSGLVVALGAVVTAPANFFGGYLSDRLRNPLLVVGMSLAMLATTTFLLVYADNLFFLLAVIIVNGIFVQLYFGPLFNVPLQLFGAEAAGLMNGFGNFFANLGGFTFAYTLGALKDATGSFNVGLYALAGFCLFALACTFVLSRMKPRTEGIFVAAGVEPQFTAPSPEALALRKEEE